MSLIDVRCGGGSLSLSCDRCLIGVMCDVCAHVCVCVTVSSETARISISNGFLFELCSCILDTVSESNRQATPLLCSDRDMVVAYWPDIAGYCA